MQKCLQASCASHSYLSGLTDRCFCLLCCKNLQLVDKQIIQYFCLIFHMRIEEPNLSQMFPGACFKRNYIQDSSHFSKMNALVVKENIFLTFGNKTCISGSIEIILATAYKKVTFTYHNKNLSSTKPINI